MHKEVSNSHSKCRWCAYVALVHFVKVHEEMLHGAELMDVTRGVN